ncbi:MAG: hypothetical protein ACK5UJ_03465, partial [Pseudobdellovibrionaceae bacterium]
MKRLFIYFLAVTVFSLNSFGFVETRHTIGDKQFVKILDGDLIVGLTIGNFQLIERIDIKFSNPAKKNYLEASYTRSGGLFVLQRVFSDDSNRFYASDKCIRSQFSSETKIREALSLQHLSLEDYRNQLSDVRLDRLIESSCGESSDLKRQDIKNELKKLLQFQHNQESSREMVFIKECIGKKDPIVASFIDHFPFLFRENPESKDFIVRKIKCDLNEDGKLGVFSNVENKDSPSISFNSKIISGKIKGSKTPREGKLLLRAVILKELLRASGMRDETVSDTILNDCILESATKDSGAVL